MIEIPIIPPSNWSTGHWLLLHEVRARRNRVSDHGTIVPDRMRLNWSTHPPAFFAAGNLGAEPFRSSQAPWQAEWSTDAHSGMIPGHDDFHVLADLVSAGMVDYAPGIGRMVHLTSHGEAALILIDRYLAKGALLSDFEWTPDADA